MFARKLSRKKRKSRGLTANLSYEINQINDVDQNIFFQNISNALKNINYIQHMSINIYTTIITPKEFIKYKVKITLIGAS